MAMTGVHAHLKRIRQLTDPVARKKIGMAVYAIADVVRVEAVSSITEGSISGPGHIPSRPGEPPKADTRQLDTNIIVQRTGEFTAQVVSRAPYSAPLEFGTSKMLERPFMRPAARKGRAESQRLMARAITDIVNRRVG